MKYIFCIVLLFSARFAYTQTSISGTVTDKTTNEVLPGVNIFLPGLNKGTVTDNKGNYRLMNMPNGFIKLQYSFVGYKTVVKSIHTCHRDTVINISMEVSALKSEEVTVSAGAISTQHENAIKIETIDATLQEAFANGPLMKSISAIPGVDVISKGDGVITPVIRGLSTTNIIVLNNGTRMENFQFSVNHPFLADEAGLDRVEVIKGPASLLYGSDAIGGVINLVSEKPAPVGTVKGDVQLRYHTNSQGVNIGSGINATHKNVFWGIRGNLNSTADYLDGNGEEVPNSRYNTKSLSLYTGVNEHFGSFRLYYKYNQMNLGLAIPNAFGNISSNSRKNNIWYQDLSNHLILFKNKIFINHWIIEPDFNYQLNHRKLNTEPGHGYFTDVDMKLQTFSYQAKARYNFSGENNIIFGYQGMYQQNTNADAPSHVLPDYKLTDNSAFTLYQAKWGHKLNIQAGARYDLRNYNVPKQEKSSHSHEEAGHGEEGGHKEYMEAFTKSFGNFSGSAGLTYHAAGYLLLRANVATAYRTPHISELTQDGIHGNRYELGSHDLKSQRNYEFDISAHLHTGRLKWDIALFLNHINNYIYLSPTNNTTDEGMQIFAYQQNNSKLYGLETGFEYFPYKWVSVKGTYSHVTGKQLNSGYLPFIPQDKINFSVGINKKRWRAFSNMYLNAHTQFAFGQNHPSAFETKTGGYQLVGISGGLSTTIQQVPIDIGIFLNNLLDVAYIDHLSTLKGSGYFNAGRDISLQLKIPLVIGK